jgi:metallo-beta-lactamase family protein
MHLIANDKDKILLDCGMFQGRRKESKEKNEIMPFDPRMITNVVLSHAHIDHSGRLPLLTKQDFAGRIICTRATAAACEYLLPDSAHIQESDAQYLNYKMVRSALQKMEGSKKEGKRQIKSLKKNKHKLNVDRINELIDRLDLEGVTPLYSAEDAQEALSRFDGNPYRHPVTIGDGITCTFYDAGHILGSAISIIRAQDNGRNHTIGFTGDIGRFDKPILEDPTLEFEEADREIDLLIMESTYGDRRHEPVVDLKPKLKQVLVDTYDRGGTIMIPSFAFGRTQELLYVLHELYMEDDVPRFPVYVDSPLATNITRVFVEHPETYDDETHETFLEKGKNPFQFEEVNFVRSVEGRILHHLRHKIHDAKNTVLIVGYMAQNTLGRRILELGEAYEEAGRKGEPPILRFMNKDYPLKARVVKIGGFSAHGDRDEMYRFLQESNLKIKKIALVHGEEDQILAFEKDLKGNGFDVVVPKKGETISL